MRGVKQGPAEGQRKQKEKMVLHGAEGEEGEEEEEEEEEGVGAGAVIKQEKSDLGGLESVAVALSAAAGLAPPQIYLENSGTLSQQETTEMQTWHLHYPV